MGTSEIEARLRTLAPGGKVGAGAAGVASGEDEEGDERQGDREETVATPKEARGWHEQLARRVLSRHQPSIGAFLVIAPHFSNLFREFCHYSYRSYRFK